MISTAVCSPAVGAYHMRGIKDGFGLKTEQARLVFVSVSFDILEQLLNSSCRNGCAIY